MFSEMFLHQKLYACKPPSLSLSLVCFFPRLTLCLSLSLYIFMCICARIFTAHMIGLFLGLLLYFPFDPYIMGTPINHADHIYFPHHICIFLKFFVWKKKKMEGGDQNLGNGIGGSRWNPTKEQINMLESLYRQGLRTPSAEQIQQITARLRDFGHIEGKNVFYWFQNHKARQRQKQKQESFAFYNRFLHATTPVFPPYQNVVCSPCYISPTRNEPVYYQPHPKVPLPTASGSLKRSRLIPQSIDSSKQQPPTIQRYNTNMHCIYSARNSSSHHQETLDLFPIHPTGNLQSSRNVETDHDQNEIKNPNFSANNPSRLSTSAEKERDGNNDDHPFFDFFGGN